MTKRLLVAALLAIGFAAARPAMAFTDLVPPFGSQPVSARVGSRTIFGLTFQVIVWQNKSSGACSTSIIGGASGLNDDYLVHGTTGEDQLEIQPWFTSNSFCGSTIAPLVYGGHFIDLDGGPGPDAVICASKGDSFIFGSEGDDVLLSFNPAGVLSGGPGNDSIYADGSPANQIVFGDSGNDCLFSFSGAAQTFNCGDGSDTVSGTVPVNATSCESTASLCPRNVIP